MRLVLVFVALLVSLPLPPQARPKGYELDYYRVRLESVETDGARGGVIGNPENEQGFTTPGYRDSTIRVVFTFEPTHVDFSLTNESDSDFGIIWDEAVFVDGVSNAAEGVFHRGVKLLDRHDAQVPSVVVKGSCVSESRADVPMAASGAWPGLWAGGAWKNTPQVTGPAGCSASEALPARHSMPSNR